MERQTQEGRRHPRGESAPEVRGVEQAQPVDLRRMGAFLRQLRCEQGVTQEALAEQLGVSARTVSRWENGTTMPDLVMVVELAKAFGVSIPELIGGGRKEPAMDAATEETARTMATYGEHELRARRRKTVAAMLAAFGALVVMSALAVFPRDSSWGSVYATAGAIVVVAAAWALLADVCATRARRVAATAALAVAFAAMFLLSDYVGVTQFNQPPRFCYQKEYMADSTGRERMVWRTPLYSVVSDDPSNQSAPLRIQAS